MVLEVFEKLSQRAAHCCRVGFELHSVWKLANDPSLALPAFMRNEVPEKTRRTNRHRCLKFMMEIAARGDLGEQETLILALGQVAR